jgi:hypothetical protein
MLAIWMSCPVVGCCVAGEAFTRLCDRTCPVSDRPFSPDLVPCGRLLPRAGARASQTALLYPHKLP